MATKKQIRWSLSVADLNRNESCQLSQDQFQALFGSKDVVWNRRNYNKAMATYVEYGADTPDGNYTNYMRPDTLWYKMYDAYGFNVMGDDLPDGYNWNMDYTLNDNDAKKARQANVDLIWKFMEKLRKRGVHH